MERIVKLLLCICVFAGFMMPANAAGEQMSLSTLITAQNVQSKSGYILFTAVNKQFLANISNVNTNQGMLKITPADNNYYFQPGIVLNIYKYIELNLSKKPVTVF